VGQVTI